MSDLSHNNFALERLDPPRFPLAKQFYKQANYHSHVGKEDEVYILRNNNSNNKIVAAVRLVKSDQYLILRSMVVAPSEQRQGIGSRLLTELKPHLANRECWCFPFEWLKAFYAQIGFQAQNIEQAPPYIAESLRRYIRQGRKLILMKYPHA